MAADDATEDEQEFELPRRFGRYVLFDRIGRGGMADIYLARGTTGMGASRLAVVKLVLRRFASDPAFAAMLVSEARLAARLSHANVVQTFDLGREEDRLYIAMEYVEGYDLTQLLKKLRAKKIGFPAEFGFFVMIETLRGLDYAHRRMDDQGNALGLVHRDVSPSNVLVSLEGEVKLCDFGIARAVTDLSELPEGALEGKAAYMSPEHARGEKVDPRADVFSATTILWEILSGRRMYKAQEGREVLATARAGDVPTLPDRGLPDYPRLSAIVSKGLAPDRDQRYPTAGAMLRDLEDYVAKNRIATSPMRFGAFLTEHFEAEIVGVRRERERAAIGAADPSASAVEVMPALPSRDSTPPAEPSRLDPDDVEPDDAPDLDAFARSSAQPAAPRAPADEPDDSPESRPVPVLLTDPGASATLAAQRAAPEAPKRSPALAVGLALALVALLVLFVALRG